MTIHEAQWLVPQRVIFGYAQDEITNDEMQIHNTRMLTLLEQGDAPVYVLLVTHPDSTLPKPSIASGRKILSFIGHHKLGCSIIVHNPNSLMARMSVILASIANVRHRHFGAVEEALTYIQNIDDTVDWQKADMSLLDILPDYPPSASNSV